ncbi:MAG: aspartyl protease family protein, partial [Caulobacteraceae bacterium]
SNMMVGGVGGATPLYGTIVKVFSLGDFTIDKHVFAVGGSEIGEDGLLGQNELGLLDDEYDLGHGAVRFVHPIGCGDRPLAYWAGSKLVSVLTIYHAFDRAAKFTQSYVEVDGKRALALFDTGAGETVLSQRFASSIGIKPGGPGVEFAGAVSGVGPSLVKSWTAPVANVKIGGEEIRNTRLHVAPIAPDILLGDDFFLSHRVYVANSQGKIYFTYEGGPVFNASGKTLAEVGGAKAESSLVGDADETSQSDPATLVRLAAALAARHDEKDALSDLDRACAKAPRNEVCFLARGRIYAHEKKDDLALTDFDRAIVLDPSDPEARIARARIEAARNKEAAVQADLLIADKALGEDDRWRVVMADTYLSVDDAADSIRELNGWIRADPHDALRATALKERCLARSWGDLDLAAAEEDCEAAIRMVPKGAPGYAARGYVRLRQERWADAASDFDRALGCQAKEVKEGNGADPLSDQEKASTAMIYWGLGLAEIRQGSVAKGKADIAAAEGLDPHLAARAAKVGLSP